MTACTFAGQEYSEGSVVCQGGRLMRCQGGNWGDTGADCDGNATAEQRQKIDEAIRKLGIRHIAERPKECWSATSTWFAALELVKESGGILYGPWNNSLSSACVNTGFVSAIARDALARPPQVVGSCSGFEIVMVEVRF